MKKVFLFIILLIPIVVAGIFFVGYEEDEMKFYKQLNETDTVISAVVNDPTQSMSSVISSLQQRFEDLVEIGITFTEDQDISENFDQFNQALEKSNQLVQQLTKLFEQESITNLEKLNEQAPDTMKEIVKQEQTRINQLKDTSTVINQINTHLATMNTVFYSNKNNEVFNYINTAREYFNQIKEEYTKYSQSVTEYMKQKSDLYSQIKS